MTVRVFLTVSFFLKTYSLGTEEGLIVKGLGFKGITLYLEPTFHAFTAHGKILAEEGNQRKISSFPCFSVGRGSLYGIEIPISLLILSDLRMDQSEVSFKEMS